ncbi:hypothetical protein [Piscibacillus halophilus]|nr:hypothetical protein [Piscibacillus halophilus]
MAQDLLQMVVDYVFNTVFVYLAPIVLVITMLLFSDELIELIQRIVKNGR